MPAASSVKAERRDWTQREGVGGRRFLKPEKLRSRSLGEWKGSLLERHHT
jgi:hypothetical protein